MKTSIDSESHLGGWTVTRKVYAVLMVIVVLATGSAVWTQHAQAQRSSMRQQWEYRVVVHPIWQKISHELMTHQSSAEDRAQAAQLAYNQLGADGWELVSVEQYYVTFKRAR